MYSFVASAGASIGLLGGGVLTEAINWHWIFFVNVPIGLATALLAARLLDGERGIGLGRGADLPAALLVVSALMLAVYTILGASDHGWGSTRTLGFGGVALALLGAFVVREARIPDPLIPLRIFRSRIVSAANLVQALMVAGMLGMFFLGALYLQRVLGYGPLGVGLAFLPVALAIGALSLGFSARLIVRFGARAALLPGLVLLVAGLVLLRRAPVDGQYLDDILPSMLLLGVGAALGLAVLTTLSTTRTNALLALGDSAASALTGGYHLALAVGVGLVVAAVVITATLLRPRAGEEAPAETAPGAEDCADSKETEPAQA